MTQPNGFPTSHQVIERGYFGDLDLKSRVEKVLSLGIFRVRFREDQLLEAVTSRLYYAKYTRFAISLDGYPEYPGWTTWDHVGAHERIGHKYWNFFHAEHPDGTLEFGDSPDFHGLIKNKRPFWGDINQVGLMTFSDTLRCMPRHSLWISVTETQQVVIEPEVDMRKAFEMYCNTLSSNSEVSEEDIRRLFDDPEPDEQQWQYLRPKATPVASEEE